MDPSDTFCLWPAELQICYFGWFVDKLDHLVLRGKTASLPPLDSQSAEIPLRSYHLPPPMGTKSPVSGK